MVSWCRYEEHAMTTTEKRLNDLSQGLTVRERVVLAIRP